MLSYIIEHKCKPGSKYQYLQIESLKTQALKYKYGTQMMYNTSVWI